MKLDETELPITFEWYHAVIHFGAWILLLGLLFFLANSMEQTSPELENMIMPRQ
jgi:hypothetical protein